MRSRHAVEILLQWDRVRMGEASKGQSRPPEFLSTHPSDETRVHQIDDWLPEAKEYQQPAL